MLRERLRIRQLLLAAFCVLVTMGSLQAQSKSAMKAMIKTQFDFAARQYKLMAKQTPADKMPQTFDPKTGKSVFSNMQWWCSGFYPGTLWLIYEQTGDKAIKAEAENGWKYWLL